MLPSVATLGKALETLNSDALSRTIPGKVRYEHK